MKAVFPTSLFAWLFLMASCASPGRIDFARLSDPQYIYIFDFQSRVAQEKMRMYENNEVVTDLFIGLIGISGNDYDCHKVNDQVKSNRYTTLSLINNGTGTLHVDLLTDLMIDYENSCSVKQIQLPKSKSISIITVANQGYTLKYSWASASETPSPYLFTSGYDMVLLISESAVNQVVNY